MPQADPTNIDPLRRGFHVAAGELLESGWLPFPLPRGQKMPPPDGLTGRNAFAVKAATSTKRWRSLISDYLEDDDYADANTGVRLRHDVFALDIDEYVTEMGVTKSGWKNLVSLAESRGLGHPSESLPPTLRLTSRGFEGTSGQRFYRLPEDADPEEVFRDFPGELTPGVEILRPWHRFTIESGSTHPLGGVYKVYDERRKGSKRAKALARGLASITPDDLPVIPEEWLDAILTSRPPLEGRGEAPESEGARSRAADALEEWVAERDDGSEGLSSEELLSALTHGTRRALLEFDSPQRNNSNLPSACISLLASLLEDMQGGQVLPLRQTLESAKELYTRNGDRLHRPSEFDRAMAWAFPLAQQAVASHASREMVHWTTRILEDDFWGQTEALRSARRFARYRMVSPEAMLACALVLVASWLPPHLTLPPLVGGESSLNFYVALCASSGGGKSAAMAAAKEWLQVIPHPDANLETDAPFVTTIATGEGLLAAYTTTVPKKGKKRPGELDFIQHRRSVRFDIDEIQSLGAAMSRDGSTLKGFLKQMWTGSAPATLAVDSTRTRKLEDHSFRTTVVAGVQPASADVILSDHGGGFPQRWLWIETWDEHPLTDEELDREMENPPAPLPWTVPRAAFPLPMPRTDADDDHDEHNPVTALLRVASEAERKHEVLQVTDSIRMKVRRAARSGRRIGDVSASMEEVLDGHRVHLEEKLAALLAALHGHIGITEQFERMAEWLAARSDQTRAAILRERRAEEMRGADERAKRQGRTEAMAEETKQKTVAERFAERVLEALMASDGEMPISIAKRRFNLYRAGDHEAQVAMLEEVPGIVVEDDVVRLDLEGEGDE